MVGLGVIAMIKQISKWGVSVLAELRSLNSAIARMEERQKSMKEDLNSLSDCVDSGYRKTSKKILTKHYKEGSI